MIKMVENEIITTKRNTLETKFIEDKTLDEQPLDEQLFDLLANYGPLTRNDLVKLTKKPRTTVYDYLIKLILQDKVIRYSRSGKKPGRPKVYFKALL
jgi:hypothetical protein